MKEAADQLNSGFVSISARAVRIFRSVMPAYQVLQNHGCEQDLRVRLIQGSAAGIRNTFYFIKR